MLEIFESALYQYVWCPGIFSGRAKGNAIHLSSGTGRMDSCRGKWESGRIASVACVFLWKNMLSLRRWRIIKIYWILVFRRLKA